MIKNKRKARRALQKDRTDSSKTEFYKLEKQVKDEIIKFKRTIAGSYRP